MNLIYYDLYQAARLEKFVTGMFSSFSWIFICIQLNWRTKVFLFLYLCSIWPVSEG